MAMPTLAAHNQSGEVCVSDCTLHQWPALPDRLPVQATSGQKFSKALPLHMSSAGRVLLPPSLALGAFLAGLDDVRGTWPDLHIAFGQWRALMNFIAWRVLPDGLLDSCRWVCQLWPWSDQC